MSSAADIEYFEIVSRKDRYRMTYKEAGESIKMKPETTESGYKQGFVRAPVIGADRHLLYLLELDSNNQALPTSAIKCLCFIPNDSTLNNNTSELMLNDDSKAKLVVSSPSYSQSQVWRLEEYDKDVWLIQSSNGKYLRNKGSGKAISVSTMSSRDRNNKSFHWLLHPIS